MLKVTSDLGENVVFIEEIHKKSKKGNDFTLVSVGLPDHYTTLEFFKDDNCTVQGLAKGDKVKITLGVNRSGYNQSYNLMKIEKVK